MGKHRDFDHQDIFYASWTDALQEFIGNLIANLRLTCPSTTIVRAGPGPYGGTPNQTSVGIKGLWRYRTTNYDLALSGAAGTRYIWVVAVTPNDFVGGSTDPDETDYNFELRATTGADPTGVEAFRILGWVVWDGSKIIELVQLAGAEDQTLPISPSPPTVDSPAIIAKGLPGQVRNILEVRDSAGGLLFGIEPDAGVILAPDTIDSTHLQPDSVGSSEIAADAVGASELGPGSVAYENTVADMVRTDNIQDAAVTAAKIATTAVTATKVAIDAIYNQALQNNAVTAGKIANGAVTTLKLDSALYNTLHGSFVHLQDRKSAGTPGGPLNAGAWVTRTLNTKLADPDNVCNLSGIQFILAAGTYRCWIDVPANKVLRHQIRLRNVTGGVTLLVGSSEYSEKDGSGFGSQTRSVIVGRFTVAAAQTLEVQHRVQASGSATDGAGVNSSFDEVEVYANAVFLKE